MRSAAAALGVEGPAARSRRLSRAALLMLAGGLLLAAVSAVALVRSGGDGQSQPTPALDVATNSVAAIGAHDAGVELAVPLPGRPTDVAVSRGTAWVSTVDSTSVTGVSGRSRSITRTVLLVGRADAVAAGEGSVWVADGRRGVVSRIVLGYEHVAERYRFRPSSHAAASGGAPARIESLARSRSAHGLARERNETGDANRSAQRAAHPDRCPGTDRRRRGRRGRGLGARVARRDRLPDRA